MAENGLYETLAAGFGDRLDEPCLISSGGTTSYRELDRRTAQVVSALTELGVSRGDRVVVQATKSAGALSTYLGILRSGAVLVPLNPGAGADEVAYFVDDAEPTVTIGPSADWTLAGDETGSWERFVDQQPGTRPEVALAADDPAAFLYTSGTTGRSKGAVLTQHNLASNATTLHRLWGFRRDDVLLHSLPIFHTHGLFVATNTALLSGIPIRFHERFDVDRVLADLLGSTVFMGVPTMYTRLLGSAGLDAEACRSMRLFTSGSAPLLPETFDAFARRTGHTILERYGMTETGMLTSNPYDGERRVGTVGRALPDVSVRVAVDDAAVAADTVGDVQVRGPNVFAGYWRRPDKTAEEHTADGWFRTGDVGSFDSDGYLTLVGRSKDLVISGGFNVYPREVEELLDQLPGVVESAVVGVAHTDLGEGVVAVLVIEPDADEPTVDTVVAALRPRLSAYKLPRAVHLVDDVPRNTMGKVRKNELRDRYAETFITEETT